MFDVVGEALCFSTENEDSREDVRVRQCIPLDVSCLIPVCFSLIISSSITPAKGRQNCRVECLFVQAASVFTLCGEFVRLHIFDACN